MTSSEQQVPLEQKLHRTWIQILLDGGHREIAAMAVDGNIEIDYHGTFDPCELAIYVPTTAWSMVDGSAEVKEAMKSTLRTVCRGQITDQNGNPVDDLEITFRVQLVEVEEGWQNIVKNLIANAQDPNQGVVTEKVFSRRGKQPILYNEMKFASQSEVRIAQELERRDILFLPLPLAVRAETGNFYSDHREIDFLICEDGAWGILEVSFHPDRFEKDSEKDTWFKKSGILCIQHYTAERCYNAPSEVVEEFLEILAKHRR